MLIRALLIVVLCSSAGAAEYQELVRPVPEYYAYDAFKNHDDAQYWAKTSNILGKILNSPTKKRPAKKNK